MNTPQTDPTPNPRALLQQLEDAGPGEKAGPLAHGRAVGWRGFAFTIEDLDLVVPLADGLEMRLKGVPGREAQPLPLCRAWVRGIIAVGGEIYTVIDFAQFIGRRPVASAESAGLLLMPGDGFNCALLLDSRISLRTFSNNLPVTAVGDFDPALAPFLRAVLLEGEQPWGVLNIEALKGAESFVNIGRSL